MSSLPYSVADSLPLPAGFWDKKAVLLAHMARSERLVEVRPASQLAVRPRPEMLSSGVPEVDTLTGGIPRGGLTELWGAHSSGKTSVLLAAMAAATSREETCVLIDASDSFDPGSGQAAGVDFAKLLWVRCGAFSELSPAVGRRLSATRSFAADREPIESQPSKANDARRTTSDPPRVKSQEPRAPSPSRSDDSEKVRTRNERRLEQVLKTTDLILQSGGFGLVALDLAGIPEKFVRRIPLASWFRFQRAVEHTKTALLVVSEVACAQTCAALVLKLQLPVASSQHPARNQAGPTLGSERLQLSRQAELLGPMRVEVELVRSRWERKPMQSVKRSFTTQAVRAG